MVASCDQTKTDCADFLSAWNIKPQSLKYLSCEKVEKRPAVLLVASYLVKSNKAKEVESLLHNKFNMPKLRFLCCGWENRPASYIAQDGLEYEISMYSYDESAVGFAWEDYAEYRVEVGKYIVLP